MIKFKVFGIERWDNEYYDIGLYDTKQEAEAVVAEKQKWCKEHQDEGLRDSIGIREIRVESVIQNEERKCDFCGYD